MDWHRSDQQTRTDQLETGADTNATYGEPRLNP